MQGIEHIGFTHPVESDQAVKPGRKVEGMRLVTFEVCQFERRQIHDAKLYVQHRREGKAKKENPAYICGMDMIKITILDREGVEHELDAPTDMGLSVMELCKSYELPVEGTCGGMALCASCHVYVHSGHDLPEPTDDELAMLDSAFFVKTNSRLGCQIKLHDSLDGLKLELAPVAQ